MVAVAVAIAIALRVWILLSPLGRVDGDEAIVGLMAIAFGRGHPTAMFWGQGYGGTIEPGLTRIAFLATGPSAWALKLVPIVLAAVSAVLLWRIALRILNARAAAFAGALILVYPPFSVWWSTKARGIYWAAFVLVLVALLYAMRFVEEFRRRDIVAFGLVVGLAWWTNPQTIFVLVPLGVWLVIRSRLHWRELWPALPATIVGALPWLWWNTQNSWRSLNMQDRLAHSTYLGRLELLITKALPEALGFMAPYSHQWLFGPVGLIAYFTMLTALAGLVVALLRHRDRRHRFAPVLAITLAFPWLYAIPKQTEYIGEPRFLQLLIPPLVVLLCARLTSVRWQYATLAVAAVLAVSTLTTMATNANPEALKEAHPPDISRVTSTLKSRHIRAFYASYWTAYPISFDSGGSIAADSLTLVRDRGAAYTVAQTSPSTYVVRRGSREEAALELHLRDLHVHSTRWTIDAYEIYFLDRRLAPREAIGR